MLTLHHLEYSQSFRILWLLEELEAEYQLKLYDRDPKSRLAPTEYKRLSPLGTAPVITDGDLVLAESNAIIDYLLDKHPQNRLRPDVDSADRQHYLFWFHAAPGSLMPMALMGLILRMMSQRSPALIRPVVSLAVNGVRKKFVGPRISAFISLAEQHLGEHQWFGGSNFSGADIAFGYTAEAMRSRNVINDNHPNFLAWIERIEARPAYQRAVKKDGKDSIILAT